jgi:rhodanese-related sulfurtransferase
MTTTVGPESTMREILEAFPGAQRALFRRYHIGGCSSCGFQSTETLAGVCQRNGVEVREAFEHIQTSHEQDAKLLLSPGEVARLREQNPDLRLLDVRTREEHEAVSLPGSILMSQTIMQEILSKWPKSESFIIYDHQGKQCLDAAAYFAGHGFSEVRCLRGGIDAWAQEVDKTMPRYQLS